MSEQKPRQDSDEGPSIQCDVYGIKIKVKPGDINESQPASWSEVGQRINRHLMSLASGLVAFVDEVVLAARSVVRGIARLPDAIITRKVDRAHEESDRREDIQQKKLKSGEIEAKTPEEARRSLENWLNKQRVKGNYVTVQKLGDGNWLLTVVRPEAGELTTSLAERALLQSGDISSKENEGDAG